jgi:hypothetical protein
MNDSRAFILRNMEADGLEARNIGGNSAILAGADSSFHGSYSLLHGLSIQ